MTGPAVQHGAITSLGVVARRATARPDDVALAVEGGPELTYGGWELRSNAIARGLAGRGVGAGDRVALLFDLAHWVDFAVAHLGVLKAGAVPVLLSPGAPPAALARALSDSKAAGLLWAMHRGPPAVSTWAARPEEVGRGDGNGPVPPPVHPAAETELVYPPAPLAATQAVLPAPEVAQSGPVVDGCLVHAFAPGSLAGRHALALVLAGPRTRAATPAAFAPDSLCALVARERAVACGFTPALAAAVVASGATDRHDLSSVTRLLLTGPASPDVVAGLRLAFPTAAVAEIDPCAVVASTPVPSDGPDPTYAPVALSQEAMVWHEQFTAGSFNLPCLVRRYEGPLDVAALEWALSELIRRHEPLRSTFEVVGGEPRQVVAPHPGPALVTVDLSALSAPDRDAEAAQLLADATGRPFDLARGPLFEPRLVRLGDDDHLLVVRLHHTVFDDWSVDVFRRELSALYAAGLAGEPSPLVEPRTSFTEFSRRQRARLAGDVGAAQRSWWRGELAGAPLAVQVPIGGDDADGGRPAPGEPVRLDLPPSLAAGLRALAPQLRATPFMTVLAAFSVLLARVTGQEDLVIATVVAHRGQSDLEPLVGCFTKKIPVRLRLEGDPTFPELVARTRTSLLGALSHQDVAFDAVVRDSLGGPAADHGAVPQVAVVFQGETPQQVKLAMPGLSTGPYQVAGESRRERHFSSGPEKADEPDAPEWGDGIYLGTFLILSLLETAEGMALVARGVFDRPAARRLLERFRDLLADVVADPSRHVAELSAGEPPPDRSIDDAQPDDVVELRGFRARRSRLEGALGQCPGVAEVALAVRVDVDGEARLVAYVVADGDPPPTLAQLRHALWAVLPGALWPADAVMVDALARLPDGRLDLTALPPPGPASRPAQMPDPTAAMLAAMPDPTAAMLAAMWAEVRGQPVEPGSSYWQDFSFLDVLVEARQAGLAVADEQVVRSRTLDMLAAALGTARRPDEARRPASERPPLS